MTKSTGKDETIATAGIISNVRVLKSKKGDFYAQATLEDMSGSIEMIVFPEAYKRIGEKVKLEVPVLVQGGRAHRRRSESEDHCRRDHAAGRGQGSPAPRDSHSHPLEASGEATIDDLHSLVHGAQRRGPGVV